MLRVLTSAKGGLVCISLNLAHEMDNAERHTAILLLFNKKWFIYSPDFDPRAAGSWKSSFIDADI